MNELWTDAAWNDCLYWQMQDGKTLRRINELIKDIERNGPLSGPGNPERMRYTIAFSRRIGEKKRLVCCRGGYGNLLIISSCGHYED